MFLFKCTYLQKMLWVNKIASLLALGEDQLVLLKEGQRVFAWRMFWVVTRTGEHTAGGHWGAKVPKSVLSLP